MKFIFIIESLRVAEISHLLCDHQKIVDRLGS